MTPNLYIRRQRASIAEGRAGQALPLLLVTTTVLLALAFSSVHLVALQSESVRASNAVDAVALSAATWEARGLNVIAALNDGVNQCLVAIRCICVVWAVLAVAAATGYGVPLYTAYSRYAKRVIRSYWRLAKRLAAWAEKVRKGTPYLALEDALSLSVKHGATVLLRPSNPAGRHDASDTLELHLADAREVRLGDAFAPLYKALKKMGGGGGIRKALDLVLRTLVGESGGPIRLLVPEDDLPKRQFVRAEGVVKNRSPFPRLSILSPPPAFPASATAEPYGGGWDKAEWKSRLLREGDRP
jgi:hypothetical protein